MKKIIGIIALLLIIMMCFICIKHNNKIENQNFQTNDAVENISIDEQINKIIEPYIDDEGYIKYDKKIIKESSMKVYEYAKDLKKKGEIIDCTYCEQSDVVAFFYDEKMTSLYIPNIKETYTGATDEFSVTSVETINNLEIAVIGGADELLRFRVTGAVESANLINDKYEEYILHNKITNKTWNTMDDVVNWMGNFSENKTRVVLWRGHGGTFTELNGELMSIWGLPVKWDESCEKYLDDEHSLIKVGDKCAISSNFWKNYCDDVEGGLFFTVACNTGVDGGYTANIFFDKGFSTYAAPNGSIWTTYADKMMGRTVEYMCGNVDDNKYNFDEAIVRAREDINDTDVYGVTIVHGNAEEDKPFELVPKKEEDMFNEYFKLLINKYGLTAPVQKGTMYEPSDEWFNPEGILSAYIYDLDSDKDKEALVIRVIKSESSRHDYVLKMEVYEIEHNKVVMSSSIEMDSVYWNKNNFSGGNMHVSIIEKNEDKYIFCEQYMSASFFVDEVSKSYWALKYDGELRNVVSFLQTAGGSSGFKYSGNEYKDGRLINEELLYVEESFDSVGKYDNYQKAISKWFEKYGIYVVSGLESGVESRGESILSSKNSSISITDYLSKSIYHDYKKNICKMEARLYDRSKIRDIISY